MVIIFLFSPIPFEKNYNYKKMTRSFIANYNGFITPFFPH